MFIHVHVHVHARVRYNLQLQIHNHVHDIDTRLTHPVVFGFFVIDRREEDGDGEGDAEDERERPRREDVTDRARADWNTHELASQHVVAATTRDESFGDWQPLIENSHLRS